MFAKMMPNREPNAATFWRVLARYVSQLRVPSRSVANSIERSSAAHVYRSWCSDLSRQCDRSFKTDIKTLRRTFSM